MGGVCYGQAPKLGAGNAGADTGAFATRSTVRAESLYDKAGARDDVWLEKLEQMVRELEGVMTEELPSGNWAAVDREVNSPLLTELNITLSKLAGKDKVLKAQAAAVKAKFFAFVDEYSKKSSGATAAGATFLAALKEYATAVK